MHVSAATAATSVDIVYKSSALNEEAQQTDEESGQS